MQNGPIKAIVDGTEIDLIYEDGVLTVAGRRLDASLVQINASTYSLLLDGKSYEVTLVPNGESMQVTESAVRSDVRLVDRIGMLLAELRGSSAAERHTSEIRAPMPGLVLKVEVEEGASVKPGQGLLVLEAMKMENEIFAAHAGIVAKIHVSVGATVTKGEILVTLEDD